LRAAAPAVRASAVTQKMSRLPARRRNCGTLIVAYIFCHRAARTPGGLSAEENRESAHGSPLTLAASPLKRKAAQRRRRRAAAACAHLSQFQM